MIRSYVIRSYIIRSFVSAPYTHLSLSDSFMYQSSTAMSGNTCQTKMLSLPGRVENSVIDADDVSKPETYHLFRICALFFSEHYCFVSIILTQKFFMNSLWCISRPPKCNIKVSVTYTSNIDTSVSLLKTFRHWQNTISEDFAFKSWWREKMDKWYYSLIL